MNLCEKLKKDKFIVTSEIGPPKGTDITRCIDFALEVKDRVDAINVTDLQSSVMRLGSLATSKILVDRGIEPIYQLTCRDRNRLALQSDLLSAYVLGIRNVLLLTGDHPKFGDHPQAKCVYDLDSVTLAQATQEMRNGRDMAGKELRGGVEFCVGAAVNPGADPLEAEIIKTEKKIKAGVEFFQTQAVFDTDLFRNFLDVLGNNAVPVIAGIVVLKNEKTARYMNEKVPGVHIPEEIIDELESARDKRTKSIEIAARLIRELKGMARGVHIMPIGSYDKVAEVLDAAEL